MHLGNLYNSHHSRPGDSGAGLAASARAESHRQAEATEGRHGDHPAQDGSKARHQSRPALPQCAGAAATAAHRGREFLVRHPRDTLNDLAPAPSFFYR